MAAGICACVTRLAATLKPEYAEALQAIDVGGRTVVDIWGGWRDRTMQVPWDAPTTGHDHTGT